MQRRESKARNIRSNGGANRRALTGFYCWGIILLLLFGCSSNKIPSEVSKRNTCFNGNGILNIESGGEVHRFRFESLSKEGTWIIGIEIPIIGERVIKIGNDLDLTSSDSLLTLIGQKGRIGSSSLIEIFSLLNNYHLLSKKMRFPREGITYQDFSLKRKYLSNDKNFSHESHYVLDLMHNGWLFNTSVATLVFDFRQCAAHN